MSEWVTMRLGELIERRTDFTPVEPDVQYVILGVQRSGWGFVRREPIWGRDQKFTKLLKVEEDDLVYRTITAFEAPSAVAGREEEGHFVTPQTFPVFRLDKAALLPAYMRLLTTSPKFHHEMASRCTGTVLRRKTLSVGAFADIPVVLPPLLEQRRIIDVMASVDAQIDALEAEVATAVRARVAMLDALLSDVAEAWPQMPLGALGTFVRGRRFTKSDYVDSGLGCIHYGQIYTHYGSLARRTATFLPSDFRERMRLAEPGNLVIAATGEDPGAVGKAVAWLGDEAVAVHDDAQIYRHSLEPRYASYLTASSDFQSQKRRLVSDMKLARVSSRDLASITVPVPPQEEQGRIADVIEGLDATRDALASETGRLRAFRSALLTSLLNGDTKVTESYDDVLGRTA